MLSYSTGCSNFSGKRGLHSRGYFYGQQGRSRRLPTHADAMLGNVHDPQVIRLSQHFSMQATESTANATGGFHASVQKWQHTQFRVTGIFFSSKYLLAVP